MEERIKFHDILSRFTDLTWDEGKWVGECPFETNCNISCLDSFSVCPQTEKGYCSGCGKGGDLYDMLLLIAQGGQ